MPIKIDTEEPKCLLILAPVAQIYECPPVFPISYLSLPTDGIPISAEYICSLAYEPISECWLPNRKN